MGEVIELELFRPEPHSGVSRLGPSPKHPRHEGSLMKPCRGREGHAETSVPLRPGKTTGYLDLGWSGLLDC